MSRGIPVLAAILSLIASSVADERTWTDHTGQLQVEAEFIAAEPGRVWLRRDDGERFVVPLTDLSKADQEYVQELVRQRDAAIPRQTADAPGSIQYGPARQLAKLSNERIDESSGLACSRRRAGLFWTHNDSGDDARIYAFDSEGRDLGSCVLSGVIAYDWEDIVSFQADGRSYLLVCDVGNNGRAAPVQMLHLVEEPIVDPERGVERSEVPVVRTICLSYEDDHRDCEAVAVDPTDKTILLVAKEWSLKCRAYALPWPPEESEKAFVARPIATLNVPMATAMDVSPDGRRAVVLTYLHAFEYTRHENEEWAEAFARPPRKILMPLRSQGESICYGLDGKTLYLTSENPRTPLWEVPVVEGPSSAGPAP